MDDKLVAWTLAAPSAPVVKDPDVRPPTTVAAAPTYRFVALSKLFTLAFDVSRLMVEILLVDRYAKPKSVSA